MGVRLTRLPKGALRDVPGEPAPRARRRPPMRGSWRCCGVNGCGEVLRDVTWASVERHIDGHGSGRAEQVLELDG